MTETFRQRQFPDLHVARRASSPKQVVERRERRLLTPLHQEIGEWQRLSAWLKVRVTRVNASDNERQIAQKEALALLEVVDQKIAVLDELIEGHEGPISSKVDDTRKALRHLRGSLADVVADPRHGD
jgi:hypothetical protein